MTDVDEIIDYTKSLKRGFDKDLFQSKIDELAHIVSCGLDYDDFHTLFKVWLNLSIPITKWVSLGSCLVPQDKIDERTVDYAFRWLLANYENHSNFSRMAFVLDWLTVAMDCGSIDMVALDAGYEIFYTMLSFEVLTPHTIKLLYTLTKPSDVTRRRVLELLDYAKKREGKKNMYRHIQVLLGLFKSYKPECVPEDVPAIPIHTSFKKINMALVARFRKNQENRNTTNTERRHLMWINPLNLESRRNKKADPLVPNVEFSNIGSKQYADKESQKNYLDFSDPVSLLQYSLQHSMCRPARLRALLCNETGLTLLAIAPDEEQAFLSYNLYRLLCSCFLDESVHSYEEKQDLLQRLAVLQRTLAQGIPMVTRFCAQYLQLWNEMDYFGEILELVQWVSAENIEDIRLIVRSLTRSYHRATSARQCAILRALGDLYTNLVYASTKKRQHFMGTSLRCNYAQILPEVAASITDMCNKAMQINPDDTNAVYGGVTWAVRCARAGVAAETGACLPGTLALALPLLQHSALLVDKMAAMLLLYKRIFSALKATNKLNDEPYVSQRQTLQAYSTDVFSCLYHEQALRSRNDGLIFTKLKPQLVSKLEDLIPGADGMFSLRNSLTFAAYTYGPLEAVDPLDASNKWCFDAVMQQNFPYLSEFFMKAIRELRT